MQPGAEHTGGHEQQPPDLPDRGKAALLAVPVDGQRDIVNHRSGHLHSAQHRQTREDHGHSHEPVGAGGDVGPRFAPPGLACERFLGSVTLVMSGGLQKGEFIQAAPSVRRAFAGWNLQLRKPQAIGEALGFGLLDPGGELGRADIRRRGAGRPVEPHHPLGLSCPELHHHGAAPGHCLPIHLSQRVPRLPLAHSGEVFASARRSLLAGGPGGGRGCRALVHGGKGKIARRARMHQVGTRQLEHPLRREKAQRVTAPYDHPAGLMLARSPGWHEEMDVGGLP